MAEKKYNGDVVREIQDFNDRQTTEEARNPLAGYSTLQLKSELSRRKVRRGIFGYRMRLFG